MVGGAVNHLALAVKPSVLYAEVWLVQVAPEKV